MIDELARPRVGIVVPGGLDEWEFALAARVLTLGVLDRVPRARVSVLVSGGAVPAASGLDCGRPARRLEADDRQRLDVLLVVGEGTAVRGRGGCEVVRVKGIADIARAATSVGTEHLRRNRVELLRLLGWMQGGGLPEHVGVDEVVAAVSQGYEGPPSIVAAIAAPAHDGAAHAAMDSVEDAPNTAQAAMAAVEEALNKAATAAVECWKQRGSPGAVEDARPGRRVGTQHAAMRVEMRALERQVEAAETAVELITGSRTWRYSERMRDAYHAARRRLQR